MSLRQVFAHRSVDGKPTGILTTVERLAYLGYIDGKPAYELSRAEKWRSAFITLAVGVVLAIAFIWSR